MFYQSLYRPGRQLCPSIGRSFSRSVSYLIYLDAVFCYYANVKIVDTDKLLSYTGIVSQTIENNIRHVAKGILHFQMGRLVARELQCLRFSPQLYSCPTVAQETTILLLTDNSRCRICRPISRAISMCRFLIRAPFLCRMLVTMTQLLLTSQTKERRDYDSLFTRIEQ